MNAFTSNASLIIHPADTNWSSHSSDDIIATLSDIGLIGDSLENSDYAFQAGESFLDHIAFMGCAPNIQLIAVEGTETFTQIRLISTPDKITAFTSNHSHAPHCPNCKISEKNWQQKLTASALECAACGKTSCPWDYNWRRSAGFGRFFVEITEIYPQEAIPQESLLSALQHYSGTNWNYFYHYP